ncbi:cytochrome P450 [Aspergillus alliaceus]|uniref:Cytochrome P450 n=1 Tax=Petromyces alliaceus TaxID=209559 RepID=A0A5N7BUK0_PETAA|nr:cytochrome P450 [Aspergillus alliaceus]
MISVAENTLRHTQSAVVPALGLVVLYVFLTLWNSKPRVPPNIPILRVSSLPGKRGEQEDLEAFQRNASEVIQHGYELYSKKGKHFLLRTPKGFYFIVAPQFIEEIRKAPETLLSAMDSNNQILQVKYTLHPTLDHDWYEFRVIHTDITRNLGPALPDLADQIQISTAREIGSPQEWAAVHMWPACLQIVTQTTNRSFFGKEIANNDEFTRLASNFAYVVFGGARIIDKYPHCLRPFILRQQTNVVQIRALAKRLLGPMLKDRILRMQDARRTGCEEQFKHEKPFDVVQWVLDIAPPKEYNDIDLLIARMLHVVVSAVHTSSQTFLDLLYDLTLHPEVIEELRKEIQTVLAQEGGWSLNTLSRMIKLDSFIKESSRHRPFTSGSLERNAMVDFTLSDGSVITKGTHLSLPHLSIMFDKDIYGPDADQFNAFRFSDMRTDLTPKHTFVHCTPAYLHFGYGRYACPGRFFASAEMKMLLSQVLMEYDVRYPAGQAEPKATWYGWFRTADQTLKLEWRKRVKSDTFVKVSE